MSTIKTENGYITQDEAAEYLGISKRQFLKLFKDNKIKGYRIGDKTFRFKKHELDESLRNQ